MATKPDIDAGWILGFDPGGQNAFGVAALSDRTVIFGTVNTVGEALNWVFENLAQNRPVAAGIDTLLHWSAGPGGWRHADKILRERYPEVESSIMAPNSLFGAMAIGGAALALRLRERWQSLLLNETHPKVLLYQFRGTPYDRGNFLQARDWLEEYANLDLSKVNDEHQLDAVVSAWATRTALQKNWNDLVMKDDGTVFPAGDVTYYWPPS